ncbi:MAG TPA: GTPase Era [Peptococcaceae bacterium]|nr:MAG: GTPase Era [Clostridia bacterium 41_269]HBT20293.1 GTPase Era [Peptococcaceae bacterium]
MEKEFKSGFVSIIGRPNVGKSTLLNSLVGTKVAIMSDKPQTTRNKIRGILSTEDYQIIFIDTPGIHKPRHKLGEYMVASAVNSLEEVDLILFMVDVSEEIGPGDEYIINILKKVSTPVFLVINKIDLVKKTKIMEKIISLTSKFDFAEVVPVSAATRENLETLLKLIVQYMPQGPKYYPDDMVTDNPERFIIEEIIREKVLKTTRDEVPHSVAVQVEELNNKEDLTYIRATIYTEKDSQKGIIIGSKGQKLKEIGREARLEIENLFGNKVYLDLWVKVKKDWRKKEGALHQFGYYLD